MVTKAYIGTEEQRSQRSQKYMSCVRKGPTPEEDHKEILLYTLLILFHECDDYVHQMFTLTDTTILSYNLPMRFVFLKINVFCNQNKCLPVVKLMFDAR